MTYEDAIGRLIATLEAAAPEIRWDRDALDMGATESTGAVELTGQADGDWADGRPIDAVWTADIWISTPGSGTELLPVITEALMRYDDTDTPITWSLPERHYLYDVRKVAWRWQVHFWGILEAQEPDEETESDG